MRASHRDSSPLPSPGLFPSQEPLVRESARPAVSSQAEPAIRPDIFLNGVADRGYAAYRRRRHRQDAALSREPMTSAMGGPRAATSGPHATTAGPGAVARQRFVANLATMLREQPSSPARGSPFGHLFVDWQRTRLPAPMRDALLADFASLEELRVFIDQELVRLCAGHHYDRHAAGSVVLALTQRFFEDRAVRPVRDRLKQALRGGASHLRLLAERRDVAERQLRGLRSHAKDGAALRAALTNMGLDGDLQAAVLDPKQEVAVAALQRAAAAKYREVEALIAELPSKRMGMFDLAPNLTAQALPLNELDLPTEGFRNAPPRTAAQEALLSGLREWDPSHQALAQLAFASLSCLAGSLVLGGGALIAMGVSAVADTPSLLTGYNAASRREVLESAGVLEAGTYDREVKEVVGVWAFGIALSGVTTRVVAKLHRAVRECTQATVPELIAFLVGKRLGSDNGQIDVLRDALALSYEYGQAALADSGVDLAPVWHDVVATSRTARRDEHAFRRVVDAYCVEHGGNLGALIARGQLEEHFREFVRSEAMSRG